jgi:uncharacterized protein YggE
LASERKWKTATFALLAAALILLSVNLALIIPTYSAVSTLQAEKPGEEEYPLSYPEKLPIQVYGKEDKTLTVTGVGVSAAKPDRVQIGLSVITRGSTASEAQSLNTEKMNAVVEALKNAGVSEKQMKTVSFSLNPIYEYPERKTPVIIGYECRNSLMVVLDDIDRAGEIVDLTVSAGAVMVGLALGLTVTLLPSAIFKPQTFRGEVEGLKAAPQIQPSPAPLPPPTYLMLILALIVALGIIAGSLSFLFFRRKLKMVK